MSDSSIQAAIQAAINEYEGKAPSIPDALQGIPSSPVAAPRGTRYPRRGAKHAPRHAKRGGGALRKVPQHAPKHLKRAGAADPCPEGTPESSAAEPDTAMALAFRIRKNPLVRVSKANEDTGHVKVVLKDTPKGEDKAAREALVAQLKAHGFRHGKAKGMFYWDDPKNETERQRQMDENRANWTVALKGKTPEERKAYFAKAKAIKDWDERCRYYAQTAAQARTAAV